MLADWTVECSAEDPVLVVPWSDPSQPENGPQFIDLRENPYDLDQIAEAELHPPLMQALRALNAPRSPVFTAKCDAWTLDSAELDELRYELDLTETTGENADTSAGFASYIDLIWRDRSVFASFHQSEQILHRLARLAAPIAQPYAMLECVLRPALVDLTTAQEGYSVTVYVKALGPDLDTAKEVWSAALEEVVALLRSKDIALG
jgi:hypothetical protein